MTNSIRKYLKYILIAVILIPLIYVAVYFFSFIFGFGAGTLGGFDSRTFPVSKKSLSKAFIELYKIHPEYKIHPAWEYLNDWNERGYDFLDSRLIYFDKPPRELYYITFIGDANDSIQQDTSSTSIAIRAVTNKVSGWTLEENYSAKEKERIENRFDDEIISRLEIYTGSKAIVTY